MFSLLRTPYAALLVVGGCSGADLVLAEPHDWALVTGIEDPWDETNEHVACPARAAVVEEGFIELDTKVCSWITVSAPARAGVRTGTALRMLFFHSALVADEPSAAVVGVAVDGETLWQREIPIPSASAFEDVVVTVEHDVVSGAPMTFHVHNHGANSYRLGSVTAEETR
jgi:hypothetical protein